MTGKQMFVRSMLTMTLPLVLIAAFVSELISGFVSAFGYAWLEVRIEVDEYRQLIRRKDY